MYHVSRHDPPRGPSGGLASTTQGGISVPGISTYTWTLPIQGVNQPISVIFYTFSPSLPTPTHTSQPATTTFLQADTQSSPLLRLTETEPKLTAILKTELKPNRKFW